MLNVFYASVLNFFYQYPDIITTFTQLCLSSVSRAMSISSAFNNKIIYKK
jgi:hypothetical protein